MNLQEHIAGKSGTIRLAPDEYRGPLVISKPCEIDGRGATIWCEKGPVITVRAPHVTLRNLRIEITGPDPDAPALAVEASGTVLHHVEVYGGVSGLGPESGPLSLPRTIDLGTFAADRRNVFVRRLTLPAPARVRTDLSGLRVEPAYLPAGETALRIVTDELRSGTSVFGEIFLDSGITRRIYVRGHALAGAPQAEEGSLPDPAAPPAKSRGQQSVPPRPAAEADTSGKRNALPRPAAAGAALRKGERCVVPSASGERTEIRLAGAPPNADIDCYVFCLDSSGKVRSDEDLIFFGQPTAQNGAVRLLPEGAGPGASIEPAALDPDVERLQIVFSRYSEQKGARSPQMRMEASYGADTRPYPLPDLGGARTVTAAHLYRHGGGWKLWTADHRSQEGIEALCRSLGVEVA